MRDFATGAAISGAKILILGDTLTASGTTDDQGKCPIVYFGVGPSRIRVAAKGYSTVHGKIASHMATQGGISVHLSAPGSLVVRLKNSQPNHERGYTAIVSASTVAHPRLLSVSYQVLPQVPEVLSWRAGVDSDECQIDELPSGVPLSVEIVKDGKTYGRLIHDIALLPGERREISIEVGQYSLIGRLHGEEQNPIENIDVCAMVPSEVSLWSPHLLYAETLRGCGATDSYGDFLIDGLYPGTWQLMPSLPFPLSEWDWRRNVIIQPVEVSVFGEDRVVRCDVALRTGQFVSGHVRDQSDRGVDAARLRVYSEEHRSEGFTASDGAFSVGPMPRGVYSVELCDSMGRYEPVATNVSVDASTQLDLRMLVGARIAGRVIDKHAGYGIEALVNLSGSAGLAGATISNENGEFEIGGVPPGQYIVVASTPDGLVGIVRSVRLERGGVARVLVEMQQANGLRVRLSPHAEAGRVSCLDESGFSIASLDLIPGQVAVMWADASMHALEFRSKSRTVTSMVRQAAGDSPEQVVPGGL